MKYYLLACLLSVSSFVFGQTATPPPDQTPPSPVSGTQSTTSYASLNPKQKDSLAKNLAPIPGKAIVYILRPGITGFMVMMRLDCDSFQVGWIGAKSYLFTVLDPGEHTFIAKSENENAFKLTVEAGKIYYLNQEPKMGFAYARTKLATYTEEEGKKHLMKCGLSKENRYPMYPLSKDVEREPPKSGN